MSLTGVKVRPTSQTPEGMRRWPRLTLYHYIQRREASEYLHSTSRSGTNRSRYP